MDIRVFTKGDGWRITVNNETRLVAETWDEVNAFVKKMLEPAPKVRDKTAYELKQDLVDAGDGEE